jgi:hypothetical protein
MREGIISVREDVIETYYHYFHEINCTFSEKELKILHVLKSDSSPTPQKSAVLKIEDYFFVVGQCYIMNYVLIFLEIVLNDFNLL